MLNKHLLTKGQDNLENQTKAWQTTSMCENQRQKNTFNTQLTQWDRYKQNICSQNTEND